MLKKLRKNSSGFTIIEVLIVLAIAGLIMVVVFMAVPALQRNQRNNARNSEATQIVAAINECLANRNGQTGTTGDACGNPASVTWGNRQQLTTDPAYAADLTAEGSTTGAEYRFGATCNATTSGMVTGTARQFAVVYMLEPDVVRCVGSE